MPIAIDMKCHYPSLRLDAETYREGLREHFVPMRRSIFLSAIVRFDSATQDVQYHSL